MAAEHEPIRVEQLTVQELIVLSCEQSHWFRKRTPALLLTIYPNIDMTTEFLVHAMDSNYPGIGYKNALATAEKEMSKYFASLGGIKAAFNKLAYFAGQGALAAIAPDNSHETQQAALRAMNEVTWHGIFAIAWEKAQEEELKDPDFPNPFHSLLELYNLGVAKVWAESKLNGKMVASLPVLDSQRGPVLASRVCGSVRPYSLQSWTQVFPTLEDSELTKSLKALAEELGR